MNWNPLSPSQSKWSQSLWSQSTPMTHWSLTFSRANMLYHFSISVPSGVHRFITNVIKSALLDSIERKYKKHITNRGVDKKCIVTSRYKRLTPNQPVSAIPLQCQKSLEAGALMWPAAKQAPRSAVHGWTRSVYLPKKKKRRQTYIRVFISTLTYYCVSEVFARPPLSNKASLSVIASMSSALISILATFLPVWWLQVWFAGAEWGELEWPEAQKPPFEQSNLLVLLDWWGFLLGKCIHLFN